MHSIGRLNDASFVFWISSTGCQQFSFPNRVRIIVTQTTPLKHRHEQFFHINGQDFGNYSTENKSKLPLKYTLFTYNLPTVPTSIR